MLNAISATLGETATDKLTIRQFADYLDTLPANTGNKYRAQLGQFYTWAIAKGLETVQKLPSPRGRGAGGEGFIFNGLVRKRLYKNAS